ncbi:hypothetical protein, partial [Pseudomonas viridiflava]|uniref:hypothetical protein n=1 Tax=Pseudomonas viridiflava TaxID=33069 RepID=UPI00197E8F72
MATNQKTYCPTLGLCDAATHHAAIDILSELITPPMLMNTLSEDVIHLRQIILKTEAQTKE